MKRALMILAAGALALSAISADAATKQVPNRRVVLGAGEKGPYDAPYADDGHVSSAFVQRFGLERIGRPPPAM